MTQTYRYEIESYAISQQFPTALTSSSVTVSIRINGQYYIQQYFPQSFCFLQPDIFGHIHIYINQFPQSAH